MKSLFFILMILTFWGCSGGQGTNTTLSVSRSFVVGAQSGGLMLYIQNKTKNTQTAIALQSTTKTLTLEHGDYNFKAVGWAGVEPMQGDLQCGETNANLKDPKATVEISINKTNCQNESFVPSAFKATGGVATLNLVSCSNLATVTGYGSTCDDSQRGTIASYRVRLVSYEPGVSINSSLGLTSPCILAQSFPNGTTSTGIKLPYGNAAGSYPTTIETFLDGNCSSSKVTHYYPFGLGYSPTGSTSFVHTNGYYANFYSQSSSQLLTVDPITMTTSNSNPGYAKIGDTVTIGFGASRAASFSVKINGILSTVTDNGSNYYTATHTLTGAEPEGAVSFEMTVEGSTYNQTTDMSYVNFVKTVSTPVLALYQTVSPSTNPSPNFQITNVGVGSTVNLYNTSNCTNSVNTNTAGGTTLTLMSPPLAVGSHQFSAKYVDVAGNVSACSNSVIYTYEQINITNLQYASTNANPNFVKAGEVLNITFTSNYVATFTAAINGQTASVNNIGGTNYQITYPVTMSDSSGSPILSIVANGLTIIPGQTVATISVDNTVPTTPIISRYSPTDDASHSTSLQIYANNLEVGGTVKIYYDPSCTTMATQGTIGASSMNLTVSGLSVQQYQFYTRQYDLAGNASPCSSALPYRVKAPFKSVWRTSTAAESITLPLLSSGVTYNFKVDWGDGTAITTHTNYNATHTYAIAGDYTVTITGTMEAWSFNGTGSKDKIKQVIDFGEMGWKNLYGAFKGCQNLTTFNGGVFSLVTDMGSMFSQAPLVTPNTTNWDTSKVTNMASLFYEAHAALPNTTNWDVSKVTTMASMFEGATVANPNTGAWNTSSVTNMSKMFKNNPVANPNTAGWDMSAATIIYEMFYGATAANPDVSNWNTSNVTQMDRMFYNATVATPNTTTWDTSRVTTMTSMFEDAIVANPDTSNWDLGVVQNLDGIFTNSGIQKTNWSKFLIMAALTATTPNASIYVNAPHDNSAVSSISTLETNLNWTIDDQGLQP